MLAGRCASSAARGDVAEGRRGFGGLDEDADIAGLLGLGGGVEVPGIGCLGQGALAVEEKGIY